MEWATYLFISQEKESIAQGEESLIQGGDFELISVRDECSQEGF